MKQQGSNPGGTPAPKKEAEALRQDKDSEEILAFKSGILIQQRIEQVDATQVHQPRLLLQEGEVIRAHQELIDACESRTDPLEPRAKPAKATRIASLLD